MDERFEILHVARTEWHRWQAPISAMEKGITYPLGQDRFEIDHGEDYFAFFARLGEPEVFAGLDYGRVVAVAVFVRRDVAEAPGLATRSVWYACDLKVAAGTRGRGLLPDLLRRARAELWARCPRGYGISMNPAGEVRNRVVTAVRRLSPVPVEAAGTLAFVTLDFDGMRGVESLLREHRGDVSYLSLAGRKDIVLECTGRPMPLLHCQYGAHAEAGLDAPRPGHAHMFCFPLGDPIEAALGPDQRPTATLLRFGMEEQDWRFILTSDI